MFNFNNNDNKTNHSTHSAGQRVVGSHGHRERTDERVHVQAGGLPPLPNVDLKRVAMVVGGAVALGGAAYFVGSRIFVSAPHQYIVKTGLGVRDLHVAKTAFRLPFQQCSMLSVEPSTFTISIDSMSRERISFRMPTSWSIGPDWRTTEALERYARLMAEKAPAEVDRTVSGVIQGEVRVLTANINLEDLFQDRERFKTEVVERVATVIEDFGLTVYNANIAELDDLDAENRYFAEQKQRALQHVNQEARVATAEAVREGEIGESVQRSMARRGVAEANTSAVLYENQRAREVAESQKELDVARTSYDRDAQIARIEAEAKAAQRRWELQRQVEESRIAQQTEALRADQFSKANVDAEVAIRRAEGEAAAVKLAAEAKYYAAEQEAKGVLAMKNAEAEGLRRLVEAAGGTDRLNRFNIVGQLPQLAEWQASALQGLQPKVSIWQTGGGSGGDGSKAPGSSALGSLGSSVGDLFRTSLPVFDQIKQQTGYDFLKAFQANDAKLGAEQTNESAESANKKAPNGGEQR